MLSHFYMAEWDGTERDYVMETLGFYGNYDKRHPCWFTVYPCKGIPCIIVAGKGDEGWFAEAIDCDGDAINTFTGSNVDEAVNWLLRWMREV